MHRFSNKSTPPAPLFQSLCDALAQNTKLCVLNIETNSTDRFNDADLKQLLETVSLHPNIQNLRLEIYIEDQDYLLHAFWKNLSSNTNIKCLNFNVNFMALDANKFDEQYPNVETLYFNDIDRLDDNGDIPFIFKLMKNAKNVKSVTFDLCHRGILDADTQLFTEKNFTLLKEIISTHENICDFKILVDGEESTDKYWKEINLTIQNLFLTKQINRPNSTSVNWATQFQPSSALPASNVNTTAASSLHFG